jgi:hypothetical protein
MPFHKGCKGSLVLMLDKAAKELPMSHPAPVLQKHGFAKVLNDVPRRFRRHFVPRQMLPLSTYYLPQGSTLMHVFSARRSALR